MKRVMAGFAIAAAFGLAATLSAQTTTTSSATSDREVTMTGCLERGAGGNYILANAKIDNDMNQSGAYSGGSATTAGTTGTTTSTGVTTTSGTAGTTAVAMSATAGSTWALEGGSDLDKHVGHKVQVTGKEVSSSKDEASAATTTTGSATTTATGTTGSAAAEQRQSASDHAGRKLDVKSVKMISSSCS